MNPAILGLLAATLVGQPTITVSPSKADRTHSAWQMSLAGIDRPSERTVETLKRYDLEGRYRKDPDGALALLKKGARRTPEAELVYALAELSWIEGRRAETRRFASRRGTNALDHYVATVAYAFDYLFDPDLAAGRNTTDPRYRLACDLYNASLDRLLHAAKGQDKDKLQPGGAIRLKLNGSEHVFRLVMGEGTPWKAEDVDELLLSSDFEVAGLDSRSRQFGLGVPMIGVRRPPSADGDRVKGVERFYPPEMAFPLTAVLRPTKRLRDADEAEGEEGRECAIDLVDPVRIRTLGQGPDAVSIESDLTTPLAYMWSRTDLSRYRWNGLFRPGEAQGRAGLMLLRPYEADKIPVVMVHGLASSPLAWIPMLNELLRDPNINQKYQFFLYVYPTGVPVPIAAAGLRDSLIDAQAEFDVEGATPDHEFNQMVLLGHSMGGLLSHAMALDSGDRFWELSTDRRFEDIAGPPEVLEELRHYTFFKPLPFVRRVVFLATPHRGSEIARRLVGRVVSSQISEPDRYHRLLMGLVKENPDAFNVRRFRHMPTSIDTLEPESKVLLALLGMKPAEGVIFHSIIGSLRPDGIRDTTDGVVSYHSAHIDGVASEKVVRSDHGVQKDPVAILEVRRILHEHLKADLARRAAPAGDAVR